MSIINSLGILGSFIWSIYLLSKLRMLDISKDPKARAFEQTFWDLLGGKESLVLTMGAKRFEIYRDQYKSDNLFFYVVMIFRPEGAIFSRRLIFKFWCEDGQIKGINSARAYLTGVRCGRKTSKFDSIFLFPSEIPTVLQQIVKELTGLHPVLW